MYTQDYNNLFTPARPPSPRVITVFMFPFAPNTDGILVVISHRKTHSHKCFITFCKCGRKGMQKLTDYVLNFFKRHTLNRIKYNTKKHDVNMTAVFNLFG